MGFVLLSSDSNRVIKQYIRCRRIWWIYDVKTKTIQF